MKNLRIILRVLLGLLCLLPILGGLGIFPAPTADLYTPAGWTFMSALIGSGYMFPLLAVSFFAALVCIVTNRMALAALILLPLVVNIVLFHAVVDTGLFSAPASMGVMILLLEAFFLWDNRRAYRTFI